MRAFVLAPTDDFAGRVCEAVGEGFTAGGSTDPRAIRAFAAHGAVHAVLISEDMPSPGAAALAAALKQALPDTTFVALTRDVRPLEDGSPFDHAVRFPLAAKVLTSNLRRAVRSQRARGGDTRELQAEIELRFVQMASQDHYAVLGVQQGAGVDLVKQAYDVLSLRFHPDRVRTLPAEAQERAMALYLRIGEAYRVLRNPNARMRYDHGHSDAPAADEGPQSFADLSDRPNARKYLALAQKALIAGDTKMAIAQMRFAASQDPDNAMVADKLASLERGE